MKRILLFCIFMLMILCSASALDFVLSDGTAIRVSKIKPMQVRAPLKL